MEQTPDLPVDVLQLIWDVVKVESGLHRRLKSRLWQELHNDLLSKVPTMSDSRCYDHHRYFIYPYGWGARWWWFMDDEELPDLVSIKGATSHKDAICLYDH